MMAYISYRSLSTMFLLPPEGICMESKVMINKAIVTLLLCLALAPHAQAINPEYDENGELTLLRADRNRDGYINIVDIGHLASAWLEQDCGLSNSCQGADIFPEGGDGVVDFRDFAAHAEFYGLSVDPTNPDSIHVPLTLFEPPTNTWLPAPQEAWEHMWDDDLDLPEMDWSSDSGGRGGGPYGSDAQNVFLLAQNGQRLDITGETTGMDKSDTPFSIRFPSYGLIALTPRDGGGYYMVKLEPMPVIPESAKTSPSIWGSYGTYGNPGAKPLVPILPKPDALIQQVGDLLKTSTMTVTDDTDYPYNYGVQGTRSLVPGGGGGSTVGLLRIIAKPVGGEDYFGFSVWSRFGYGSGRLPGGGLGFCTWDRGWLPSQPGVYQFSPGSFGIYGNSGAKPLVPLLPSLSGDGRGSPDDIFENAESFEMAGNLVLTQEPDDSGLLGSSNSAKYDGSVIHLFSGEVCESAVDL